MPTPPPELDGSLPRVRVLRDGYGFGSDPSRGGASDTDVHGGRVSPQQRFPRPQGSYSALVAGLPIGVGRFARHLPLLPAAGSSRAGDRVYSYGSAVVALSAVFTRLCDETGGSPPLTTVLDGSANAGGSPRPAGGGAPDRPAGRAPRGPLPLAAPAVVAACGPERLADVGIPTRPSGGRG